MEFHVLGSTTPVGISFKNLFDETSLDQSTVFCYSRNVRSVLDDSFHSFCYLDLKHPADFCFAGSCDSKVLISFVPLWLLAPFLVYQVNHFPDRFRDCIGLVACSSSSVLTKRFASNHFDRNLVKLLNESENQVLDSCIQLQMQCCILQPTLIYGKVGEFHDQNLSRLIALMRRLPFLILPADSGFRQPIHASQLALVALHIARQFNVSLRNQDIPQRIALGGDTILSYFDMLKALQDALATADAAKRCKLLRIPNRLFFFSLALLNLKSPKAFEAVLRMSSDLSGFNSVHEILGTEPQAFPVLPVV